MVEKIHWAPRLSGGKLKRLYQSDASGILDEELLDEVGTMLYQRCRSILDVRAAKAGRVRCQACDQAGRETWIERARLRKKDWDSCVIQCPVCGWQVIWSDFIRSFKRHQLNSGGALPAFEHFVAVYPGLRGSSEKMLAIDRLIHAFHFSVREKPDLPSRPVGPNLIKGKLEEVITLLDDLAASPNRPGEQENWLETLRYYRSEYLGENYGRDPCNEV
jgi:hypothetical protein